MRSVRKKKFCAMLLYAIAVLFAAVCMFAACGQKHEHVYIDGKCACGALDEDYTPPKDRFIGNVFQIVTKTLGGQVYARGSGVVINSDGWFITNSHVMEGAYYADAYFEIPNAESGESVTRLKIAQAAVDDPAKDFFIGKIGGYEAIASYYRKMDFTTEHEVGGTTFAIGYPNGTPFMEIHRGVELPEVPYFPDKLNGVSYIGTTSYFASGSSGGILLNEDLQIIGITTAQILVDDEWVKAAVSVFNFQNELNKIPAYTLYDFTQFMHADEIAYIRLFEQIAARTDVLSSVDENGYIGYLIKKKGESVNEDAIAYTYEAQYYFAEDGGMIIEYVYHWENGDARTTALYGYWSPLFGFDDLQYAFRYEWASGTYYSVASQDINYSENIDLTLNEYTVEHSYAYSVTEADIGYAKEQFNVLYETLKKIFESGIA